MTPIEWVIVVIIGLIALPLVIGLALTLINLVVQGVFVVITIVVIIVSLPFVLGRAIWRKVSGQ